MCAFQNICYSINMQMSSRTNNVLGTIFTLMLEKESLAFSSQFLSFKRVGSNKVNILFSSIQLKTKVMSKKSVLHATISSVHSFAKTGNNRPTQSSRGTPETQTVLKKTTFHIHFAKKKNP